MLIVRLRTLDQPAYAGQDGTGAFRDFIVPEGESFKGTELMYTPNGPRVVMVTTFKVDMPQDVAPDGALQGVADAAVQ